MGRPTGPEKKRVVVYLDLTTLRHLRREHADTFKPVSEIVANIIRDHYAARKSSASV